MAEIGTGDFDTHLLDLDSPSPVTRKLPLGRSMVYPVQRAQHRVITQGATMVSHEYVVNGTIYQVGGPQGYGVVALTPMREPRSQYTAAQMGLAAGGHIT